jgi:hypothetical protein
VVTTLATGLKITATNPLDHAGDIKELFLAHDHPEFPEFFDRAYPAAVRSGAKSWVGIDAEGRLVMHIARFPRWFTLSDRAVVGGVLLDLMAAKSRRTFFPALALLRQVIGDSKSEGDVDFLYGVPTGQAVALFKAAGFATVGCVQRFVFPLAGASWYTDAAARVYQTMLRVCAWSTSAAAVEHVTQHFDAAAFERPAGASSALRPLRPTELYHQCLAGYPGSAYHWLTFHHGACTTEPVAAALVRGGADRIATLFALSREPASPLSAIVPALARALRGAGYHRLAVSTLMGGDFARELTRAGFVPRPDRLPLLAYALTDVGADALHATPIWEVTGLDFDPYIP